jgi:hypothetical protein
MSELRAEQDEARAVGGTSEHKKVDVELNEMTSAWQLMQEKAMKLKCQLEREKQSLAAEKAHLNTEKKVMSERYKITDKVLELNVGGKHFSTFLSTICKYEGSMLAAMFSGRHSLIQDSRGRYFIDRPGESFAVILEWLQTGCFLWPDSECAKRRIKLELEYFGLVEALYGGAQLDSMILEQDDCGQLHEWLNLEGNWELCYRGTRDGFRAFNFHQLCDGAHPSLTIIKTTTGQVLGGFTSIGWSSRSGFHQDHTSFLFTLRNPSGRPQRLDCLASANAVYHNPNYGPTFGGNSDPNYVSIYGGAGPDLCVVDNCNLSGYSYVNVRTSFTPVGHTPFTDHQYFTVLEIEVFKLRSPQY